MATSGSSGRLSVLRRHLVEWRVQYTLVKGWGVMDGQTIMERWQAISRAGSPTGAFDREGRDRAIDHLVVNIQTDPAWTVAVERTVGRRVFAFINYGRALRLDGVCEDGSDGMTSMSIARGTIHDGANGAPPTTARRVELTGWGAATATRTASTDRGRRRQR